MATWLLACNQDMFDLDRYRRDGHELRSWSVGRHLKELAAGDEFVMWVTGPRGGLVGRGRVTGVPTQQPTAPDEYWQEPPGTRWYAPLVMEEWLAQPIPRQRFTEDLRFQEESPLSTLFAANPHRVTAEQWSAFEEALATGHVEGGVPSWHLQPGQTIKRKKLHDRYGGSRQGGISKCAKSPNVLLFTDPKTGHQHGYFDKWAEDGTFHYTGDGQKGPQTFDSLGNSSTRDHVSLGLSLRLFEGSRGIVRYVGEFAVDPEEPYSWGEAPETGGGPLRKVIRFHLVPVGSTTQPPSVPVGCGYRVADESVELTSAQPGLTNIELVTRNLTAHRKLQNDLAAAARIGGLDVFSPGVADPDFDLGWRSNDDDLTVCEVKSLTRANETRQLRAGIGQLLDYQDRLADRANSVRAVLWVEREPTESRWIPLCERVGITLAWPGREEDVFA
ncbi:EVE domain-containing protein [Streptomyces antimicrobicus]|uniref:EVE domain-containing protein n=1 Tax=Streptomyces antimicrobicus TaxID=2883108 RepID=A0ABS8B5G1_9ACTN|nr:EVE domain-containing protein [Streptomyces antimicrobicus]MCB5179849.1 EVE domain-containing protein [Streptomyces antimicrobicus]